VHHKEGAQYPINMLRNLAWRLAPTQLVFLSDVDFMPSPGMQAHVRAQCEKLDVVKRRLVLVVPSFEAPEKPKRLPKNKAGLMQLVEDKQLSPVHLWKFPPAHKPTDYDKWYEADGKEYEIKYVVQSIVLI
jgi:glycosyltransferase-like protein LARGE